MSTQVPITPATLRRLFEFSYNVTRQNTEGIEHEESVRQPRAAGNCVNWVVGHIVCTRNHILQLLQMEAIWSEEEMKLYDRGSDPIVDASAALPFDRILGDLDRTQEMLREGFGGLTTEMLAAPLPEDKNPFGLDSFGEMLATFNFHEAYHAGQTGILRRIMGREGAIN